MWDEDELIETAARELEQLERSLHAEHAVKGLDFLAELDLHPLIAQGFEGAGYGVFREWPLPGVPGARARRTERERCDIVLTPSPGVPPRDPMAEEVELERLESTLFHQQVERATGTNPQECYWLEIKSVGQFVYVDAVPRQNSAYASSLVRAITTDLKKISRERRIENGGVLLVLFTAGSEVAEHDLPIALHRVLDRGVAFRPPRVRSFTVSDRIGNGCCTLALIPATGAGE